ncbi:MAG: ABC transporter permease subunit [Jatrophihabitans sp.]
MNLTIAQFTYHALLGRRRMLLLLILPALLVGMAVIIRLAAGPNVDAGVVVTVLQNFALGAVLPLLGLLAGTGAIGTEIDDGSIVYLLAKPVTRPTIVRTKLVMAIGCVFVCAALPVLLAGLVLSGSVENLAIAFAVAAAVGGAAYCVIFLLLAVVTRHAVVIGLVYALAWETLVGGYLPGAQALSVQQWALTIADALTPSAQVHATLRLPVAIVLLLVTVGGGIWFSGHRLRSYTVAHAD